MTSLESVAPDGSIVFTVVDASKAARRYKSVDRWIRECGYHAEHVPFLALRDHVAASVAYWCQHAQSLGERPMAPANGHFEPVAAMAMFATMTGARL